MNQSTMSQLAQSAGFTFNAEDTQPRILYVGHLDNSITEEFIATLFGQMGRIIKTKLIHDANGANPYAFVEFADHNQAQQALQAMNNRVLLEKEIKVKWAAQPSSMQKIDTTRHFHVFIGDLSPEVDNKMLKETFNAFGEVSDAKVIRDPQTQKSKGYGFISYPKREEAERAIEHMNGQWLGRRTIRTNWATRKPAGSESDHRGGGGPSGGGSSSGHVRLSLDEILNHSSPDNTSVYVGNVSANATDDDVRSIFKRFGQVLDIRHFKHQGYSFVKFDSRENAARAIYEMNGAELMGQAIRCSWGKTDSARTAEQAQATIAAQMQAAAAAYSNGYAAGASPQQQAAYWQYYQHYYNTPAIQQQWQAYWANGGRPAQAPQQP